jgi:hypothetical protein
MNTLTIQDIRANKNIIQIAGKYGARNVRLFGSVARGEATPGSDVDFIVEFEPGRSLLDHIGLIQELETALNRKVEVVTEKALHWYLKKRILQEAVAL